MTSPRTRVAPLLAGACTVALLVAGCSGDDSTQGGSDSPGGTAMPTGPVSTAPSDPGGVDVGDVCTIAVKGLAMGLQAFSRTEDLGTILAAAEDPASQVCENAVTNLRAGRSMTFQLLRPAGDVMTFEVDAPTLTTPAPAPPPVPPPGMSGETMQRWAACWNTYAVSNWLVDQCLRGVVDPSG